MLHHVVEYARKYVKDSERGFARREIAWQIELDDTGTLVGLIPLQDRKSRWKLKTPACPDTPNMRAGGEAKRSHFLIEVASAALLYANDKKTTFQSLDDDKTSRRHRYFAKLFRDAAAEVPALNPIAAFLCNEGQLATCRIKAGAARVNPNDWVKFVTDGYDPLSDEQVLDWWRTWIRNDNEAKPKPRASRSTGFVDLITGNETVATERHPPVKGVNKGLGRDGGDAQAPLVAMDKDAFESFGLKSGYNAAMDAETAQLYADGLSDLLEKAVIIAGAKFAYWFKNALPPRRVRPFCRAYPYGVA